ncbi:MAG: HEAT repeat domain-containing protein [Deltaproteobacteria bacterium]|nr:HEAT repeat domain-containing protein [Deltaproteobacteria bacterium]
MAIVCLSSGGWAQEDPAIQKQLELRVLVSGEAESIDHELVKFGMCIESLSHKNMAVVEEAKITFIKLAYRSDAMQRLGMAVLRNSTLSSNSLVRRRVCELIRKMGRETASLLPDLKRLLSDPNPEVKNAAILAIGSFQERADLYVEDLRAFLPQKEFADNAVFALSDIAVLSPLPQAVVGEIRDLMRQWLNIRPYYADQILAILERSPSLVDERIIVDMKITIVEEPSIALSLKLKCIEIFAEHVQAASATRKSLNGARRNLFEALDKHFPPEVRRMAAAHIKELMLHFQDAQLEQWFIDNLPWQGGETVYKHLFQDIYEAMGQKLPRVLGFLKEEIRAHRDDFYFYQLLCIAACWDDEARNMIQEQGLGNSMDQVRSVVVAGIGSLGERARPLIPDLVGHLDDDPMGNFQERTIDALGTLGEIASDAAPKVREKIRVTQEQERQDWLKVLGAMGDPVLRASVSELTVALQDSDLDTRGEAIRLLGRIPEVAEGAIPNLCELYDQVVSQLEKNSLMDTLTQIGRFYPAVVREMVNHFQRNPEVRYVWVLGRLGAAAQAVFFDMILWLEGSYSIELKEYIVDAMAKIASVSSDRHVGAYLTLLERDGPLRMRLLQGLIFIKERAAVATPLVHRLFTDVSQEIRTRRVAAIALGNLGSSALIAVPDLLRGLDEVDCIYCAISLTQLIPYDRSIISKIQAIIRDPNIAPEVREGALIAFRDARPGLLPLEVKTDLVRALQDPIPAIRQMAMVALLNIGKLTRAELREIRKMLYDPNAGIRSAVQSALDEYQGLEPSLAERTLGKPDPRELGLDLSHLGESHSYTHVNSTVDALGNSLWNNNPPYALDPKIFFGLWNWNDLYAKIVGFSVEDGYAFYIRFMRQVLDEVEAQLFDEKGIEVHPDRAVVKSFDDFMKSKRAPIEAQAAQHVAERNAWQRYLMEHRLPSTISQQSVLSSSVERAQYQRLVFEELERLSHVKTPSVTEDFGAWVLTQHRQREIQKTRIRNEIVATTAAILEKPVSHFQAVQSEEDCYQLVKRVSIEKDPSAPPTIRAFATLEVLRNLLMFWVELQDGAWGELLRVHRVEVAREMVQQKVELAYKGSLSAFYDRGSDVIPFHKILGEGANSTAQKIKWYGYGGPNGFHHWERRFQEAQAFKKPSFTQAFSGAGLLQRGVGKTMGAFRDAKGRFAPRPKEEVLSMVSVSSLNNSSKDDTKEREKRIHFQIETTEMLQVLPHRLIVRSQDEMSGARVWDPALHSDDKEALRLRSHLPMDASAGKVGLPTPDVGFELRSIQILNDQKRALVLGEDYQILELEGGPGYVVNCLTPQHRIHIEMMFHPSSRFDEHIEEIEIVPERLEERANALRASGFSVLADSLEKKTKVAIRRGRQILISQVAGDFSRRNKYSYDSVSDEIPPAYRGTPYEDFSRTLDAAGVMQTQCAGSNLLLNSVAAELYRDRPEVSVRHVHGYGVSVTGPLTAAQLHAFNEVWVAGVRKAVIDGAPYGEMVQRGLVVVTQAVGLDLVQRLRVLEEREREMKDSQEVAVTRGKDELSKGSAFDAALDQALLGSVSAFREELAKARTDMLDVFKEGRLAMNRDRGVEGGAHVEPKEYMARIAQVAGALEAWIDGRQTLEALLLDFRVRIFQNSGIEVQFQTIPEFFAFLDFYVREETQRIERYLEFSRRNPKLAVLRHYLEQPYQEAMFEVLRTLASAKDRLRVEDLHAYWTERSDAPTLGDVFEGATDEVRRSLEPAAPSRDLIHEVRQDARIEEDLTGQVPAKQTGKEKGRKSGRSSRKK